MITLIAKVQNQQYNIEQIEQKKSEAGTTDLFSRLRTALTVTDSEKRQSRGGPKKEESEKYFYESSSSSEFDEETSEKPGKPRGPAESENFLIPVSGLPLHLNVLEFEKISVAAIAG